nr:plasmid mobilization relaxosome protein MobC [Chryseosolibacter indicus]
MRGASNVFATLKLLEKTNTSFKKCHMGRKQVNEKDKRKVQVNIRLTDDEYQRVAGYATCSDLTPANWIRKKVFTGKFPAAKILPIESDALRELSHIGSNLNQVVKKINQGVMPREFLPLLVDLLQITVAIKNRINDSESD